MQCNAKKTKKLIARKDTHQSVRYDFAHKLDALLDKNEEDFVMTASDLCRRADISAGILSGYRTATNSATIQNLKSIAVALDVPSDYLLGLTEDMYGNVETMAIEKKLGLSPKSIDALEKLRKFETDDYTNEESEQMLNTLNRVLEDDMLIDMLKQMTDHFNFLAKTKANSGAPVMKTQSYKDAVQTANNYNEVLITNERYATVRLEDACETLRSLAKQVYDKYYKEKAYRASKSKEAYQRDLSAEKINRKESTKSHALPHEDIVHTKEEVPNHMGKDDWILKLDEQHH